MAVLRSDIEKYLVILNPDVTHKAVLTFEVINGVPNGDPDTGSARQDTEGYALVTDVATKRKVRDYVSEQQGRVLYVERDLQSKVPRSERKGKKGGKNPTAILKDWARMHGVIDGDKDDSATSAQKAVEVFWDVRMFGAVIGAASTKKQILGPVQIGICRSEAPIEEIEITITRMASEESDKIRTMGTKNFVQQALFNQKVNVSGHLAKRHDVSQADMLDLWEALINGFEYRPSTMRGDQRCLKLVVYTYPNAIGAGSEYVTTIIENHPQPS